MHLGFHTLLTMPANADALARAIRAECGVLEPLGARRRAIELLVQRPGKFADVAKMLLREFSLPHIAGTVKVSVLQLWRKYVRACDQLGVGTVAKPAAQSVAAAKPAASQASISDAPESVAGRAAEEPAAPAATAASQASTSGAPESFAGRAAAQPVAPAAPAASQASTSDAPESAARLIDDAAEAAAADGVRITPPDYGRNLVSVHCPHPRCPQVVGPFGLQQHAQWCKFGPHFTCPHCHELYPAWRPLGHAFTCLGSPKVCGRPLK